MTTTRIIYKDEEGGVAVLTPWLGSGLTLEQIAYKDVPTGVPFKFIDVSDLPADDTDRDLWTFDDELPMDGVGA